MAALSHGNGGQQRDREQTMVYRYEQEYRTEVIAPATSIYLYDDQFLLRRFLSVHQKRMLEHYGTWRLTFGRITLTMVRSIHHDQSPVAPRSIMSARLQRLAFGEKSPRPSFNDGHPLATGKEAMVRVVGAIDLSLVGGEQLQG